MPSANLEHQLSVQLAKAAEKNDWLTTELSYVKDQLTLANVRVSMLEGQLALHESAQNVRQSGEKLAVKPSTNRYSLAGSSVSNARQALNETANQSGPTTPTPEMPPAKCN